MRLASSPHGDLRLVTTNFDRLFQVAGERAGKEFQTYAAPTLPIPKNSRWNGLVHLHGILPDNGDDTALNRLVVTSGDFGLAYLTEGWAARFVTALFQNYTVCFAGYRIGDPVLRYMMDALAADRMMGEVSPPAWVLGECSPGNEKTETIAWEAKGVTPILYTIPAESTDHSALHKTLLAWADTYRDGVQGKEAIVAKYAMTNPQDSTQQDDFVGRMLWALSDKTGLPAKRFADFNPAPSLDWLLKVFVKNCFRHSDLVRFGVPPQVKVDPKLLFSFASRPASYEYAPAMQLVSEHIAGSRWDNRMYHLARWLVRHLGDHRLIIWIANNGGQLHYHFRTLIEGELDRFAALERDGQNSALNEIRLNAPKAIPHPAMRTLWQLLLGGRVKSNRHNPDLYAWHRRLLRDGMTTPLRLELRELLAPKIQLAQPLILSDSDSNSDDEPMQVHELVHGELVLTADRVIDALHEFDSELWSSALPLPSLLEEFQYLLRDALDLLRELGQANDRTDMSDMYLPSITPHRQNQGFHAWTSLIELLRDAWLAVYATDCARAARISQTWFELPYPTFKRLALFTASQDNCIPPDQWVGWLLADDAWWLWSSDCKREVLRLIVLQGRYLTATAQARLETAILAGPPRENSDDLGEETDILYTVWLYLAKLECAEQMLGELAMARLEAISKAHPQWRLEANESDEFTYWMSGTDDPDYDDNRDVDIAPRKRRELVKWLASYSAAPRARYEDNWHDVCEKHFCNSLFALCDLARDGEWLIRRWRTALQVWINSSTHVSRSWCYAASIVKNIPDKELQEMCHAVTYWMEAASRSINRHKDVMLDLCSRVLELPLEAGPDYRTSFGGNEAYDYIGSANRHPFGNVTQALINLLFKQTPNDNDLIPADLKVLFTKLCDGRLDHFRHGRVKLASRLIPFFRVDQPWTEEHLLPLFDWGNPDEAQAAWAGFLSSPRLHLPLLTTLKPQFLATVKHYFDLGEQRGRFATFLTHVALNRPETYTVEELRSAIDKLPQEGLEASAQALYQALGGAAEQAEDYWKNRAQPFWQEMWPKSLGNKSSRIAGSLISLAIAARGEFPAALAAVQHWLQPMEHPDYPVRLLDKSGLCQRFPDEALQLLDTLIVDQWCSPEFLERCLNIIKQTKPALEHAPQYQRLQEHLRWCQA